MTKSVRLSKRLVDGLKTGEILFDTTVKGFLVRRQQRYADYGLKVRIVGRQRWISIGQHGAPWTVETVAPLPTALDLGGEEAKRFDLLMFSLELAHLKSSKRFAALTNALSMAIPIVAQRAALIEDIQTEQWWEGITVPQLELVRLRLRDLVQHIDKAKKAIVYSNFADEIGEGIEHALPQVGEADFARFKKKARHFLKAHEDHIALHKLRHGKPLTPTDLLELEKMLLGAGIGDVEDIERAKETSSGFGRFVRSIVGLDRAAVTEAFGDFVANGNASAAQLEFVGMVIEHLADQGRWILGCSTSHPSPTSRPQGLSTFLMKPAWRGWSV